jgi:DNA-binding HxlR family transcriptional regulator
MSFQDSKTNNNISLADVLKSISNEKSLLMFRLIGDKHSNGEVNPRKLGLTRKQYYSRLSAMMEAGLINRQSGRHHLTAFGKVIYCCIMIAKDALDNYYGLKAIECTESDNTLSDEEFTKLVNTLINNQAVKEFLTKKC